MKLMLSIIAVFGLIMVMVASVQAAPFNSSNPQIVANYPTGTHGIVGENETHEGADVVKRNGNSGGFQQWFYGTSDKDGVHGDHSVWKVSKDGTCPKGWDLVKDAYPEWGDYLEPGADYCVHTNDYHVQK